MPAIQTLHRARPSIVKELSFFLMGASPPHYGRSDIRRPARRSCGASVDGTSMYARADVERDRSSKVSGRSNIRHRVGAAPRSNKLVGALRQPSLRFSS